MELSNVQTAYCSCGKCLSMCIDSKTGFAYTHNGFCRCGKKYNAKIENIPGGQAYYAWEEK